MSKMLAMEEALYELQGEDMNEQGLPPGFRFHPTDEELITFYLASKVFNGSFCGVEIAEIDINRCEPWELPDIAKMGKREWYFFSLRDRKYPTGLRTNRATEAGYWKATGKDREVYSASNGALLGMKKTLVFYKGRAPRGVKTKWVMHEYRLDGDFSYRHTCKEEWVICRIFHKAGEKKIPHFQTQNYILPSMLQSLKTQLESESPVQTLQYPSFIQQESDLKSLINPVVFEQPHIFPMNTSSQSSFSPTLTNTTIPSPSTSLFKSLLSHHEYTLKETTVPRQCKTDTNFSHFQTPDSSNWLWLDKIHQQNPCQTQKPLLFDMGCGVLGFSATAADTTTTVHELSTSIAFSRADFQMMLDPVIRASPVESTYLDS